MTKMKSKKMTKSTFAIIIMAIAMVAMLAFGGTYAYFTDNANFTVTSGQTGRISLTSGTTFTQTTVQKNIVPGEKVFAQDATLTVVDESNRAAYIFIEFNITAADVTDSSDLTISGLDKAKLDNEQTASITLTPVEVTVGEGEDAVTKTVYYILTEDNAERNLATRTYTMEGLNATLKATAGNEWQEKAITVTASVDIIQAKGFESNPTGAYLKLSKLVNH